MKLELTQDETLRECPFDGSAPELHHDNKYFNQETKTDLICGPFWVKCHTCGISPRAVGSRGEAITAWNKRAA